MNGNDLGGAMERAALVGIVLSAVFGAAMFAVGYWLFTHVSIDVKWIP